MNRRLFNKIAPLGLLYPSIKPIKYLSEEMISKQTFLKEGDLIGLITPAGPINETRLNKAIANMESLGLKVFYNQAVLEKDGYLAGEDKLRLKELHDMYQNPAIKAIWCIRGGYGTTRILDEVNFKLIKAQPKPLIGYSDITALLNSIYQKTGESVLSCSRGEFKFHIIHEKSS